MFCNLCSKNTKSFHVVEDNEICFNCYLNNSFTCQECDKRYLRYNRAALAGTYCIKCKPLHISNYKPNQFYFHNNNESNPIFIGIELELENYSSEYLSNFIQYNDDFFYYKKDYSLSDNGVEIVSHPATYSYHINNHWKNIFEIIRKYGFIASGECGLHFHIDRTNLNKNTPRFLDYLINTNEDFVYQIAGRRDNGYCHLNPNKYTQDWGRIGDHYDAVNFQNRNTIEIRICAASNDYDTFIQRLTYIKQIIDYCQSKSDMIDVSVRDFKKFISQ